MGELLNHKNKTLTVLGLTVVGTCILSGISGIKKKKTVGKAHIISYYSNEEGLAKDLLLNLHFL